ncbi:MAG: PAS domain S-box protein, partial [Chloroflexota bacterium]
IRHGDGSIRTIWDRGYPIWSENGKVERYVGVAQDVTARKEAETRLVQSERDLAEAQRVARIGNWRLELQTGRLFWSKELYRIFEIDEVDSEHRYETFINCIHPEDKALMIEKNRMAREENKPFDVIYRIIPSSGRMKFIREIGNPTQDAQGKVVGLFGIAQDITDQKLVEQELRASEEKYHRLMESLDSMVVTLNLENEFQYANGVALDLLDLPGEAILDKKLTDFLPESTVTEILGYIHLVVTLDHGMSAEAQLPFGNVLHWYRLSIQPLHDQEGQVAGVMLNANDINNLKSIQAQLMDLNQTLEDQVQARTAEVREIYERLDLATRYAQIGIWEWDILQDHLTWDDQMYSLFGSQDIREGAQKIWDDRVDPEDQAECTQNIQKALMGERDYDVEFRVRWLDGSLHWIKAKGAVLRDEQGQPVRIVGINYDITETKISEDRLKFQSLLLSAVGQAVIATDTQGRVTYWNKAAEAIYGWKAEETLGKIISEITVPQISEKQAAEIMQALLVGKPWEGEFLSQRKNGAVIWIQIVNTPILDSQGNVVALIGVSQDISERKKAENQLYESDQQNRLLFEETPEAISLLDNQGRMIRVNHAFELLTGYAMTEVIGKTPLEVGLVSGDDFVLLSKTFATANELQSGVRSADYSLICRDGSIRQVESNIFIVRQGEQENALITTRDVTTRKLAQETLEMANVELGRALRMKDEFLANMSHELRTPLNAIIGLTQSLNDETVGPVNEKQNKYLRVIMESGEHLLELINDILDLAKIESGEVVLEKTAVSIRENCEASIRMIRQIAHKKKQSVDVTIDPQADYVAADQRRFKQMIVNLLSNAVKFTPEFGKLGLVVRFDDEHKNLLFEVWDTGIGISEGDLNRLFKPFVQVNSGLSRETGGTGLGLALVAQLAKLHDGRVDAVSQVGVGSRFILSLPWVPGLSAALPKDRTEIHETVDQPAVKPFDIVLAEDNEISRMTVEDYLVFHGFEVRTATTGQEALDLVKEKVPDLILMDVMMPGMDGLDATRSIRKDYADQQIPIIGLTALAMAGDRERCLNAGMDDYMSKPFKFNVLLELIKKYVST